MVLNNKGQGLLFGVMMFLFVLLVGLALTPVLKDITSEYRDATHLGCETANTTGVATSCIVIDLMLPAFVVVLIGSGLSWITYRLVAPT